MTTQGVGGRHRVRLDWHGKLAGLLLGFVAGGMTVNQLTDDYGYRGIMIATVLGAILAVASWLRRLPSRSALSRHSTRLLLLATLAVALVTLLGPATWHGAAIAAAGALTVTAVLIPTDLTTAAKLLTGSGLVGGGVAAIGGGIVGLVDGAVLLGLAVISGGVALMGYGVAVLVGGDALLGVALIGLGVAGIGVGVAILAGGSAVR